MSEENIRIDFDKIREILAKGVRRADLFMGIGLNASTHQPPISHNLIAESGIQIQLTKDVLSENEIMHVNEEFGKWIISNGLRELLETFSIFLNGVYYVIYILSKSTEKEINLIPAKFEKLGISQQLITLSNIIEISDDDIKIVRSLNQLRNCYAHRNGRVGINDLDEKTQNFSIYWSKIEVLFKEADGTFTKIEEKIGKPTKGGGEIHWTINIDSAEFKINEEASITKKQAKEICLSILSIGERVFKNSVFFAQEIGAVEIKNIPPSTTE